MGAHREFAEGQLRVERCCRELVENSLEVYWEVHPEFADRLSGDYQESAERMLEVRWEFTVGNRELIKGSLEGCREFAEETIRQ
ncbi:hypothetical protein B296_00000175 [Ensete ventricosum]|uniref:Uncharacterized protein n=1 Tax=Ensete ventricosum TaxID=4639 RepID=A0A426YER5_ENSVE|nr:hypothetical protein B296_00000175 [Ensete ventricosum]